MGNIFTFPADEWKPLIVFVEGNIASGKSSALEYLQAKGEVVVCETPETWNFLPLYYTDKKEYMFELQVEIILSMFKQLKTTLDKEKLKKFPAQMIYVERSLFSCLHFAKMQTLFLKNKTIAKYKLDVIKDLVDTIYYSFFAQFKTETIYLSVDPELCLERCKRRAREAEKESVSLKYLTDLHEIFEQSFETNKKIVVDDTFTIETVAAKIMSTAYDSHH